MSFLQKPEHRKYIKASCSTLDPSCNTPGSLSEYRKEAIFILAHQVLIGNMINHFHVVYFWVCVNFLRTIEKAVQRRKAT